MRSFAARLSFAFPLAVAALSSLVPSISFAQAAQGGQAGATTPAGTTLPALPTTPNFAPAAPAAPAETRATPGSSVSASPTSTDVAATTPGPAGETKPPADIDATVSAGARGVGMAPPAPAYSSLIDTRLTWTFGDDDFLHKTGELIPLSPTFNIGDRPQYRLFFDNLNSRFSGRENLTHLVLYRKMPGFLPHLTTEASLVLRFDLASLQAGTGNLNSALYDSGSYIRVFYNTNESKAKEGLSAVFFPLDTDRFRLGYLYDISWGGTAASINQSIFPRLQGASPGMKVQFDSEKFYAFAGFKTATIIQPEQVLNPGGENDVETVRVGETNYGFLAGAGVDPIDHLRFDAGMGYFQQGKFDLEEVRGRPIYTYGASARVVVHDKMPVPQSVDFALYKNDPMAPSIIFSPEKYDAHELAWSVSAEGSVLEQHLKGYGLATTKDQTDFAGALQGVVRAGFLRLSATGIARNLNFVVRNVPGFIPFTTLPPNVKTDPEIFGALAADYYIQALRLTPSIGGGIQMPATFKSEFETGGVPASRTVVVRQQGDESILPFDKNRTPIFQGRVSVRWNMSEILSAVGWLQFVRDNNGTRVVRDPTEGTASLRVFQSPNRMGAGVSLQARF
jgi:hypothetical protein